MFGLGKKSKLDLQSAPIALRSTQDEPLYSLTPELAQSFRHMITGLACRGGFPARLAVVAALREEGVTYTTLALAATLANDTSARVCAVELNWWVPGMVATFGNDAAAGRKGKKKEAETETKQFPGLTQVLDGQQNLDEVLIQTSLPNLSLLPAGTLATERRPVVARSEDLKTVLDQLGARFDHLLLDIPAIRLSSDAIALASLSDACCIVVRQGITPFNNIQLALDDIAHLKILGVILNQAKIHTPRWIRALIPQE